MCILTTKFVFLCFHIGEIRLDVCSPVIISVAVDSLKHHKIDIIKTGAINVINYLQFTPHMVTPSRHDPGSFQVIPVVGVGGLGAPLPHPTEIISSSFHFHPNTGHLVLDICTCTDICPAEVFAQSLCIKEQG